MLEMNNPLPVVRLNVNALPWTTPTGQCYKEATIPRKKGKKRKTKMSGVVEISRLGTAAGQEEGKLWLNRSSSPLLTLPALGGAAIDPVIWRDEEKMKRELVAWAKAAALSAFRSSAHE